MFSDRSPSRAGGWAFGPKTADSPTAPSSFGTLRVPSWPFGPHGADGEPSLTHFGFRRTAASEVRDRCAALLADRVRPAEYEDEAQRVTVKFADPDGYLVEVYWEPRAGSAAASLRMRPLPPGAWAPRRPDGVE
jgi:catechol 2,3-dioxygenase-like lactoylglutathione lyase family enzyme